LSGLKGVDSSKTLMNPVVPQLYPLIIAGKDINTILKNSSSKDKHNAEESLGSLTTIEGFDLGGDSNNLPVITLKNGRNLKASDSGTNRIVLSSALESAPIHLRVNDSIVLQSADGSITKILKVVGFYDDSAQTSNA